MPEIWEAKFYRQMEILEFQCQDRPEVHIVSHPRLQQILTIGKNDLCVRVWEMSAEGLEKHYGKLEMRHNIKGFLVYKVEKHLGVRLNSTTVARTDKLYAIYLIIATLMGVAANFGKIMSWIKSLIP